MLSIFFDIHCYCHGKSVKNQYIFLKNDFLNQWQPYIARYP